MALGASCEIPFDLGVVCFFPVRWRKGANVIALLAFGYLPTHVILQYGFVMHGYLTEAEDILGSLSSSYLAPARGEAVLTDPIFQGLAISLVFGLASSTLLVIPGIYVCPRDGERPERPAPERKRRNRVADGEAREKLALSREERTHPNGAARLSLSSSALPCRSRASRCSPPPLASRRSALRRRAPRRPGAPPASRPS